MLLLLAFLSALSGALFGVLLAVVVPHVDAVAVLALLAASLWACRLEVMPGLASLWVWPTRRLPPPALWTAITGATIGYLACLLKFAAHLLRLLNGTAIGISPVPSFAATMLSAIISAIFYTLLLSRVLAWKHDRREDRVNGGQPGPGSRPCQQPDARTNADALSVNTNLPGPVEKQLEEKQREMRRITAGLSRPVEEVLRCSNDRPGGIYGVDKPARKNWKIFIGAYSNCQK